MYTHSIRKRETKKGNSWQIVIEGDRDPLTGKRTRHYHSVNGTKKEAQAEALRLLNQLNSGGITTASAMKTKDWLLEWHNLYLPNIEDKTRESYLERINIRIIPAIGNIQLNALQATAIQKWINDMSKTLSPKSIRNIFNILNASLKKAVELKMIASNPCIGVVLPKRQRFQGDTYTKKEIQQAIKLAEGTDMHLILQLAFSLGLRRGELLALTWHDIDFKKREITIDKSTYNLNGERKVKAPKTETGNRVLSIGDTLLHELKLARADYLRRRFELGAGFDDSNLVICQENGKPYHPDSFSNKWKRFIKKHGIRKIRFHDIRHTNATTLLAAGVDIKTVQTRLGHSDVSTTMNIYTHMTNEMNENAAKKIDDIISA